MIRLSLDREQTATARCLTLTVSDGDGLARCGHCRGTGAYRLNGSGLVTMCGRCHGTGWVKGRPILSVTVETRRPTVQAVLSLIPGAGRKVPAGTRR